MHTATRPWLSLLRTMHTAAHVPHVCRKLAPGVRENIALRDVVCYHPLTDTWEEVEPMPLGPRYEHCAVLVDRKIYVFCGADASTMWDDMACLDTVTNQWQTLDFRCSLWPAQVGCGPCPCGARVHRIMWPC